MPRKVRRAKADNELVNPEGNRAFWEEKKKVPIRTKAHPYSK